MITYKDPNYANGRLQGTVISYAGRGVTVAAWYPEEVTLTDLITGEHTIVKPKDPKIDLTPVKLGYANSKVYAAYVSRCPVRKDWKQGLRGTTMRVLVPNVGQSDAAIPSKVLGQTIIGEYPSFEACIEKVKNGIVNSMAFSRSVAVGAGLLLWHKGERCVGEINPNTHKINIYDKFFWTREEVEENIK